MSELLKDTYNLSALTKLLNDKFGLKKSGESFNTTDVEFYIKRGKLPKYLGGNRIELIPNEINIKIYKLVPNIN